MTSHNTKKRRCRCGGGRGSSKTKTASSRRAIIDQIKGFSADKRDQYFKNIVESIKTTEGKTRKKKDVSVDKYLKGIQGFLNKILKNKSDDFYYMTAVDLQKRLENVLPALGIDLKMGKDDDIYYYIFALDHTIEMMIIRSRFGSMKADDRLTLEKKMRYLADAIMSSIRMSREEAGGKGIHKEDDELTKMMTGMKLESAAAAAQPSVGQLTDLFSSKVSMK